MALGGVRGRKRNEYEQNALYTRRKLSKTVIKYYILKNLLTKKIPCPESFEVVKHLRRKQCYFYTRLYFKTRIIKNAP